MCLYKKVVGSIPKTKALQILLILQFSGFLLH